jgi:O-antigen/teichoic acid export membrane protein
MAQPLASAISPRAAEYERRGWMMAAWRYGLPISGPLATSGAHFLASLVFVRNLPAADFGIFSFVLVIVPFCMSIMAALLVLPVNNALAAPLQERARIEAACLKMNAILTVVAGAILFGLLTGARASASAALLLAAYGAVFTLRWFARSFSFVKGRTGAAIVSDMLYAAWLMAGLVAMRAGHAVQLLPAALLLLTAALAALLPFGAGFFRDQIEALGRGHIRDYRGIFRDITRWSLLGVILTELTVNAHAYLVTFISGPGPFALLAVGQILMRPASLVQSALPDVERPAMTRAIADQDRVKRGRLLRDFRLVLLAIWGVTAILAAAILVWVPQLLLKNTYLPSDALLVTVVTGAVMLVRCFRTPPSTLMQAAGELKALASIAAYTSLISILLTLAFLLAWGPVACVLGLLTGEIAIVAMLNRMVKRWEARHG